MDEPDDSAEKLTQEEIDEYREAFGMFDINGDGRMSIVFCVV